MSERKLTRSISRGLARVGGFAVSMVLLALVSLVSIPAMVAASGPAAIASVVLGQAIGAVAAVIIHLGWAVTGPARIAAGSMAQRRREYLDSVRARLVVLIPASATASFAAALAAQSDQELAALAAISAASIGLTSMWYFAGAAQPYRFLTLETIPRAAGTAVGIGFMLSGYGAQAGLLGQLAGIVVGFVLATWFVLGSTETAREGPATPLLTVLRAQSGGLSASTVTALYGAIPIVVVGFVAPSLQPAFALVDKTLKQATAAMSPLVVVLQGWVPTPAGVAWSRVQRALLVAVAGGTAVALGFAIVGPEFMAWLGNSEITVPYPAVVLTGLSLMAALIGTVSSQACLVPLGGMRWVVVANSTGALVRIAAVGLGATASGVVGAVAGVAIGAWVRAAISLSGLAVRRRRSESVTPERSSSHVLGSDGHSGPESST